MKYILPEIYFKPDSNILKPKLRTEILTLDDIFCSIDKIFQNVEVKLRMNKKLDDLNLHLILQLVGWLSKQIMKRGKIWDPYIQGFDQTELRPDIGVTIEKMSLVFLNYIFREILFKMDLSFSKPPMNRFNVMHDFLITIFKIF